MNTPMTTRPARRPWTGGEKFLLGSILVLVALVVTGTLWWRYANTDPTVSVPTPTLPSPNAFDYFVAAGNAIVDEDKVDFAIAPPGSPHSNKGPDRAYTPAERAALVRENAGALRLLRQGFMYPYQNPQARSFSPLSPYYAKFRATARLLRLQGETEEARGDWAGAVSSQLDAVEMGVKMPRGGPLIGMLVGVACQAIGRRPLWADVDHLNAAQAEAAARRLERLSGEQVPYADTLQEEKWDTQASLMKQFRQRSWVNGFVGAADPEGETSATAAQRFQISMTPKRTIMGNYAGYMDRIIADAHQPYAVGRPAPAIPNDAASAILLPVFDKARLRNAQNETQNALLTAMLALRAYRLGHGAYPATLSALVPRYLARVPDDPFALSGPLRYRARGGTYLLYSVGPDGRDDGGTPILDATMPAPAPAASSDARRFVRQDSRGDIVAGVNLY